jgi:hypothetical protein
MHAEQTGPSLGFVALALLLGCEREAREPAPVGASAPDVPAVVAEGKRFELPAGRVGEWLEARRYRFRVLGAAPCDELSRAAAPEAAHGYTADEAAPLSATTPAKPGHYRVGVTVEIEASDTVFATPRAFYIEKNGKVFFGTMAPRPSLACERLLQPDTLRAGERTSGIVVFEAPEPGYLTRGTLRFRPPRWGFESKTGAVLPSCFGSDCPEAGERLEARL